MPFFEEALGRVGFVDLEGVEVEFVILDGFGPVFGVFVFVGKVQGEGGVDGVEFVSAEGAGDFFLGGAFVPAAAGFGVVLVDEGDFFFGGAVEFEGFFQVLDAEFFVEGAVAADAEEVEGAGVFGV